MLARRWDQSHVALVTCSIGPFLAALPFLVMAVQALGHPVSLNGDPALIELGVRDVVHLHSGVGVYSRFGWHHPGPAWLVLLAPIYLLLGSSSAALLASAAVLNAIWAAVIVLTVRHLFGAMRSWLALATVLTLGLAFGMDVFRVVWNPYAVLLPTLLFLVCCWGALLGRDRYSWIAALLGSFLIQAHIGLLPLVGVGLALVAAHRVRRWSRPGAGWLLVAAVWVPTLWDEVAGSGNLTKIQRFFLHPQHLAGWRTAIGRFDGVLGRVFLSRASNRLDRPLVGTGGWLAVAFAAACIGLVVLGLRRRDPAALTAGELAGAGLAAALIGAHGVVGRCDPYLLLWACALPGLLALAGLPLLFRWVRADVARPVGVFAAAAACAVCLALVVSLPPAAILGDPGVPRLASAAQPALPPAPQTVLVTMANHDAWPLAAGVADELTRRGYHVVVANNWIFMFGEQHRTLCRPAAEVRISGVTAYGGARGRSVRRSRADLPPPATVTVRPNDPGTAGGPACRSS